MRISNCTAGHFAALLHVRDYWQVLVNSVSVENARVGDVLGYALLASVPASLPRVVRFGDPKEYEAFLQVPGEN